MVQNFAAEMAHESVSDTWVTEFLNRHRDSLLYKWCTAMDAQRHYADSPYKYDQYFKLLHSKMQEYSVDPRHTYNMDEKGFAIGILGRSKRVFSKLSYEAKKNKQSLQDGSREWVTLLATVCADGSWLPPALIFTGKNNRIQSSWVEDIEPGKHLVFVTATPSGWTNDQAGLAWLEQIFERETHAKARRSWRLLIVDGHGSHITMAFIKYCDRHRILLMIYPPHSTQTLQPLDVVCFSPLASNYNKVVTEHTHNTQGLAGVKKSDFFGLFYKAWLQTFTEDVVLQSFKATGIHPPDPSPVLDRWAKQSSELTRTPSPFGGSQWREADRLFDSLVKDPAAEGARKLKRSLHHMAAQIDLLTVENKGLRAAISQQKPSKKARVTLDLQQQKEYRSRAVFYSPRKVREAQYREKVNRRTKLERDAQKAKDKQDKVNKKLQEETEKENKRVAREERIKRNKRIREEKAAETKRKKEERAAAKALQLSQLGKRKASQKPPTKPYKKLKRSVGAQRGVVTEEPAPAPRTHTTRSGRIATQKY